MKKYCVLGLSVLLMMVSLTGCNLPELNIIKTPVKPTDPPLATSVPVGWHLEGYEYFVSDSDLDVHKGPVISTMSGTGARLLDYYQDSGGMGDVQLAHYRTDEGGKVLTSAKWRVRWTAPPRILYAHEKISIDVEHIVVESLVWKPPVLTATFDVADMRIGRVSASPNVFHQPNGSQGTYKDTREEVYDASVTMTTEYPINNGKANGDRMAIYISFGEGYGIRYTYYWYI